MRISCAREIFSPSSIAHDGCAAGGRGMTAFAEAAEGLSREMRLIHIHRLNSDRGFGQQNV